MKKPSTILIPLFVATVAGATPFVVNTTGDESDINPGDDVCATADGGCTLRAAIEETNAISDGGFGTINFSITGTGPFTISPSSPLPSLVVIADINGYSQPGATAAASGTLADLQIVLDGTNAGNANGLELTGDDAGFSSVKGLVIQSFALDGIHVTSSDNVIEGNYIGTSVDGGTAAGNSASGIEIEGGSRNVVGGDNYAARNLLSGNSGYGVAITGDGGDQNQLFGNFIGSDGETLNALPNQSGGVLVGGSATNTKIGGDSASFPALRNIISGNLFTGIRVDTSGTGTVIQGNYIGLDFVGEVAVPNDNGIVLAQGTGTVIGGAITGVRNVISGNSFDGIGMFENNSDALVQGNLIGFNASFTAALGNGNYGILISNSPNNVIGGNTTQDPGTRNFIGANTADGILIAGSSASGNVVQGNDIGTNSFGDTAFGNGESGIEILAAPSNIIGGLTPGLRNLISGNGSDGITINQFSFQNQVWGNYIGTTAAGDAALPNGANGVAIIDSSDNSIGGDTSFSAGIGNVISGNTQSGVLIQGNGANFVQGNRIGTQADGVSALGNTVSGVDISGAGLNTIGGSTGTQGNVLAFNALSGVRISSGTGNSVLSNSIFSNGPTLSTTHLGIDLAGDNAVTPNDTKDRDTGANNLQNFPRLTAANTGSTAVSGTLNSTPKTQFLIQFFEVDSCDFSGNGEGKTYLGSVSTSTNTQGNAEFAFDTGTTATGVITATATNVSTSDTSEFSPCLGLNQAITEHDVGISGFKVPSGPAGTLKNVTIKIKNYGGHAESSVPFQVTGPGLGSGCSGNAADFSADEDLDPGESVTVTGCTVNVPTGTFNYTLTVQHVDSGQDFFDANPSNNTKTVTATGR